MSAAGRTVALLGATATAALLAGLLYAFTVAVVPGLSRADPRTFVEGMQQINVAIVNPWFMISFLGAPVLTIVALLVQLFDGGARAGVAPTAVALGLLIVVLGVTAALSIPLNDALAAATDVDPAAARDRFVGPWSAWNLVRTLAGTAAVISLGYALTAASRTRTG